MGARVYRGNTPQALAILHHALLNVLRGRGWKGIADTLSQYGAAVERTLWLIDALPPDFDSTLGTPVRDSGRVTRTRARAHYGFPGRAHGLLWQVGGDNTFPGLATGTLPGLSVQLGVAGPAMGAEVFLLKFLVLEFFFPQIVPHREKPDDPAEDDEPGGDDQQWDVCV